MPMVVVLTLVNVEHCIIPPGQKMGACVSPPLSAI